MRNAKVIRVGFVGLGVQGGPIAQCIISAGFPTCLYARRAVTLEPFRDSPATTVGSVRDLGASSDVACVCVVDDAQVEEVLSEENLLGGMAPGSVAVTIMVGAAGEAYQRCLPVLETFGSNIQHLGEVGMGSAGKLVNNFLFAGNMLLAKEAIELGTRAGIPLDRLRSFLDTGSDRSFALTAIEGFLGGGAGHGVALLRKDVGLVRQMAQRLGVPFDDFSCMLGRLDADP